MLCLQMFTFMKEEECGCFGLHVLKDELTNLSCLFFVFHGGSQSLGSNWLARFYGDLELHLFERRQFISGTTFFVFVQSWQKLSFFFNEHCFGF